MNSPLRNTIRSFWTPEHTTDPDTLALIRADKVAFLAVLLATVAGACGLVACVVALVHLAFL